MRLYLSAALLLSLTLNGAELPGDSVSIHSLPEVSVTSIKQASSLLRQPVSVTTVSPVEVERYAIAGMKGVSEIAPNFYMPDYGSRMTSSIYVRGIGARIDQPAVGLNVDNIPFLNKDAYDFEMADIESVEVLRGPQSTLYGRNTIAGLINVYTLSPMRWQGVKVKVGGGSHGFGRASAGYYGKLSEQVGMSVSGYASHTNGYTRNAFNDSRSGEGGDYSLRWKTVWQPSDRVVVENTLSGVRSRQSGYPYAPIETGVVNHNDTAYYSRYGLTEGLTVKWNAPGFTLASITGLQMLHDDMTMDQDFTPLSLFTLRQKQHDLSVTQDIVMRGKVGHYSWLAGVFAFYKHGRISAPVVFKQDGIDRLILPNVNNALPPGMQLQWDEPEFLLGSRFHTPTRGLAVYHRSSVEAGPFEIAAGIRFDHEHATLSYGNDVTTSATMNMGGRPIGTREIDIHDRDRICRTFNEVLPNVSVTFNHNNSAFFASVSRGYKAGGFNTQMFSQILQTKMMASMGTPPEIDVDEVVGYRPETSWNYEVGGHFSVDRGRVYSTFSAFFIDLRDQQVTIFPEGLVSGRMMANAGRTRSFGAELTMRYAPTRHWLFHVAYGYTNATFRHFNNGERDLSGRRVPFAPENTLFLSATYTTTLSKRHDVTLSITPDLRGTGTIYWDEANLYKQPFYAEVGLTGGVKWRSLTAELWLKNLTDTQFNLFRYESVGSSFFQRGAPFRCGLTLSLDIENFRF